MKKFEFLCYGHENILGTHKNTLEFTKEDFLTKNGDCIVGINADYNIKLLKEFIKNNKDKKIRCDLLIDNKKDSFEFFLNPDFCDEHEIVIRIGEFLSKRTIGIRATKSAKNIDRNLIEDLKNKNAKMQVYFS